MPTIPCLPKTVSSSILLLELPTAAKHTIQFIPNMRKCRFDRFGQESGRVAFIDGRRRPRLRSPLCIGEFKSGKRGKIQRTSLGSFALSMKCRSSNQMGGSMCDSLGLTFFEPRAHRLRICAARESRRANPTSHVACTILQYAVIKRQLLLPSG